jgi:perosamine synthetase
VTTGEGGMVATRDPVFHRRMSIVKGQGMDPTRRYWHVELGFNYRLTNLAAAIGTAQMERIDSILTRKREIARLYRKHLAGSGVVFPQAGPDVESSEWLVSFLVPQGVDRDGFMARLEKAGVETRPTFYCAHHLPPHRRENLRLPVAEDIAARGVSAPSSTCLTGDQIAFVCDTIRKAL